MNNIKNVYKLKEIRKFSNEIAMYLYDNIDIWKNFEKNDLFNKIRLFIYMHGENKTDFDNLPNKKYFYDHWILNNGYTSRVIYSEIPDKHKNLVVLINHVIDMLHLNAPLIGKDKNIRADWRNVFINLGKGSGDIWTNKNLRDLVIHELTHTGCNHVQWRNDDHGKDFNEFEKILIEASNNIM